MHSGRLKLTTLLLAVAGGLLLAGCGSTKTVTQTTTVVQVRTVTTTTPTVDTTPTTGTTPTTATAPTSTTAATSGTAPALSGTYGLNQTSYSGCCGLPDNPHDGILHADQKWTILSGSCAATGCHVKLRRLLSDSTIEDLTLNSRSPAGVYSGTIPGGDGKANDCSGNTTAPVKLSMIVRVGGLQNINGQATATRLAGHIFADFTCPGESPSHQVATYVGGRS
jgi:hypothetical protein